MPAPALNVQMMHPVLASSEYTVPSWLPTKTRPPATVGGAKAIVVPGKPKAQRSTSLGTSAADNPACAAFWNLVLVASGLQPVHFAPCTKSKGLDDVHFPVTVS